MPIDATLLPVIGVPLAIAWIVFRMVRASRTVTEDSTQAVAQFRSLFGGLIIIGALVVVAWTSLPVLNRADYIAWALAPALAIALLATLHAHARALDALKRRVSRLEKRLDVAGFRT